MASYSPVYSAQFIVFTSGEGPLEFAVPASFTAVIRDVELYQTVGGTIATVSIQNSIEALLCTCITVAADGVPASGQWQGRVVVPGGGLMSLSVTNVGSGPSVYVGGYLIRNTAA